MSYPASLNTRRNKALLAISTALLSRSEYFKLQSDEIDYSSGVVAWSTTIEAGGRDWEIHIILTENFPDEPPKVRVPDATGLLLKNPHVLEKGYLCIIPDSSCIDSDNPVGLFFYVIESAKRILEGTEDVDFQDEFSAYWNRSLSDKSIECLVIDSPEQLPALFNVFFGNKIICSSASAESLKRWCENYFGKEVSIETNNTGILLKLKAPLLPTEYPDSLYDLTNLLSAKDREAYKLLTKQIISGFKEGFVLLTQKTENGYALGGLTYSGKGLTYKRSLHNGFRKGKIPPDILIKRSTNTLISTKITRSSVKRVDHTWIHARGGGGVDFQRRSVMVIGCGSLGGYVAHFLSRAGVTDLTLIDNDRLEWANLGRHILGADSVSKWKAEALSELFRKQMPHLRIVGISKDWRDALRENSTLFNDYDLIVSTVADWRCEQPLNYLSRNNKLPTILYGWLEPYAVAGHCLISVKGSGCLACKMNQFGHFELKVAKFPGITLKREPGGCTHYQQYGPIALLPVASLISTNVLLYLNNPIRESILKTWVSDQNHFSRTSAKITEVWKNRINNEGYSKVYTTNWTASKDCQVCY